MNILQFAPVPGSNAPGNAVEWQKMMAQLATQKGAPSSQQNGIGNYGNYGSQVQTPANANYQSTNGAAQFVPPPQPTQPAPTQTTPTMQGGSQSDPSQVSAFANSLYASLGKNPGFVYQNPTPGGNAIDQLSALQAQQANDKVNRTGMYAIDKNAGFSPAQVNAQEQGADQFYTEQKGKYGSQAQAELAAAKSSSNKTTFGDMTSGQASLFNNIVGQYNRSPLIQALDRTPVLKGSIAAVRKNPNDGATQLNLVYSYVQALDTYQSAVREGELGLVNSIDSKIGKLGNFISQVQNGQIVRADVINEIADAAENIQNTIEGSAKRKAKSFESQANTVGLGDAWKQYTSGFDQGFGDSSGGITREDAQAALQAGIITQDEFNGLNFNSVGNTQVSIPKSSGIAYANNNPGNLVYAGQVGAKRGEKRDDGTYWAKFESPDAGFNALQNQVKLDASRGLTLNSFINKYAPATENDTKTYVAQISQRLGVDPRTPISKIDPVELAKEIAMKESNTRIL